MEIDRNGIRTRLARFAGRSAPVLLGMLALCAIWGSGQARADTQVWSTAGTVTVRGDDVRNELIIRDSIDLEQRGWSLEGSTGSTPPPVLTATWNGVASELRGLGVDDSDPDGSRIDRRIASIFAGVTLPAEAIAKLTQLRALMSRVKVIASNAADIALPLHNLGGLNPAETARKIFEEMLGRRLTRDQIATELEKAYIDLAGLTDEMAEYAESLPNGSQIKAEFKRQMEIELRSVGGYLRKIRGAASLRAVLGLGTTLAAGYATAALVGMRSKRAVVIEDKSGQPIVPVGALPGLEPACRRVVRTASGQVLPNTIVCPAPDLPDVFQFPDFEDLGVTPKLIVDAGAGDDYIDNRLDRGAKAFGAAFIRGEQGNDTIWGSNMDEHLIGGTGNDSIKGRAGIDRIYGDNLFFNVNTNPATANDRLYGGADPDVVQGQLGDDLIVGGSGNDSRGALDLSIGAALGGGNGNDTIIGGSGSDDMDGGYGIDSIFAKESDFATSLTNSTRQVDVPDYAIDCGWESSGAHEQYATHGPGEAASNCEVAPTPVPSVSSYAAACTAAGATCPNAGSWRWFR